MPVTTATTMCMQFNLCKTMNSILLSQLSFQLLGEFDMVCGPESCRKFRENWLHLVPKIIEIGQKQKSLKSVLDVLQRYDCLDSSDFGTELLKF